MAGNQPNNYLPYEEARAIIIKKGFDGRSSYVKWHRTEKPLYVPCFPNRVYKDEWISWNHYLGTSNMFGNWSAIDRSVFKPYWDAVRYVHTLKLQTSKEYFAWARAGERPEDITDRPEAVYKDQWTSWDDYLGVSTRARQEYFKQTIGNPVICFATTAGVPKNIIQIIRAKNVEALKQNWDPSNNGVAVFLIPNDITEFNNIIDQCSSPYYGDSSTRIVPNVDNMLYMLEQIAERIWQ